MNFIKTASIVVVLMALAASGFAQRSRRGRANRAVQPKPAPTAPNQPVSASSAVPAAGPILLAIVNEQNVTTAHIEPKARQEAETLESRIDEARKKILELQINTLLLEAEARRRKLTAQQLYDLEVARKIAEPPAAEVSKFIEDNRDQIDETDSARMRQQVIAFLRSEREASLSEAFVKRLRASHAVAITTNQNLSTVAPSTVLATIDSKPIVAATLNERLKPIVYKLRLETYLTVQPALDLTINDLLLLAEATRRNVPPEEIVRKEISEKIRQPTEADISKFYSENKSRLNGVLESLRNQVADYLQTQDRQRLERALSDSLRKGANIQLMISEPEPPVQTISIDDDPARGDANAPVTIVEFTDFQCSACAAMNPVIDDVLKSYGNKVRLVVRDFPLLQHTNARKAAEAANAAHAQGKFFEYVALLFQRQNALDTPSLKKYASELGLDRARFDAALDSGKYAAEVKHDIDDGQMYGVESTPTIFVNGMALRALSSEALRAAIDRGLTATSPRVSVK
ncbi:MAG: DsbA family protein [Pyrinomonadaceae bacterium]